MRFSFYGLRTGIVICLTVLVLSAMLLINVVMIRFAERDLVDARVDMGRLLLHIIGQRAGYETFGKHETLIQFASDSRFREEMGQLLRIGGYTRALMVSRQGAKLFSLGSWGKVEDGELDHDVFPAPCVLCGAVWRRDECPAA